MSLLQEIASLQSEMTELRHALHRIPELAGEEFQTSALLRKKLSGLPGLKFLPPFLGTDIVADLEGEKGPGPTIVLRADIDGLPMKEETGCAFASEHEGIAHACGHDVHSICLFGAAKYLCTRKKDFAGTLRFIWQPGEENKAMGRLLVAAGALGTPLPLYCAALHVEPGRPEGEIALRDGAMMSASTHFRVNITGKGGHGSLPNAARSPLVAAAAMVTALQSVVSNRVDPRRSGVLSICHFESGSIDNIIPATAFFRGTLRALDNETMTHLIAELKQVCGGLASAYGVECEILLVDSYLATINSREPAETLRKAVRELGLPLYEMPMSSMASEDFSFMLDKVPGVFFKLGAGEKQPGLHNAGFLPPDTILTNGAAAMAGFALKALNAEL